MPGACCLPHLAWTYDLLSSRWLLSCALDAALRLWDLYEGSLHYTLHAHEGAVLACAFSPSGVRTQNALGVSRLRHRGAKAWSKMTLACPACCSDASVPAGKSLHNEAHVRRLPVPGMAADVA